MSRLPALIGRFRGLFRRGREDAETRDELRFHLEMETEKNLRAGMTPREARRRAHVRLGGVGAIREAVRDARGWRRLEDLVRDPGYGLRGLRRNPGFTIAAVASLAIPICFNTAVFAIVDSVLFGPLPVVRPAQLVDVYTSHPQFGQHAPSSYPDYLDLRSEHDVFTDMAAHSPMRAVVRVDDDVDLVMGEAVTGNYFQFLGVQPVLGRLLAPDDDRPGAARVAVISAGLWAGAFGRDPAVVGRDLHIGSQPYVVIGVASPDFYGMPPVPGGDLWIPITRVDDVTPAGPSMNMPSPGATRLERRGQRWMFIKGRLRGDVGLAQADANLDSIMAGLAAAFPDSNESLQVSLTLTDDVRLEPSAAGLAYGGAAAVMFMVGVVLLARIEGDAGAAAGDIRRELRRMEPDLLFFFQGDTLREIAGVAMLPFRIAASVSGAAGIVAMLLGAVGLYGVIAYVVARRTRELAIRSVLGAHSGSLLRLVLASGAWVIAVGAGVGAALAALVARLAAQVMPGVAPGDPLVWAGVLLLIVGVTAAAHVEPARRILRLDLTRALHAE